MVKLILFLSLIINGVLVAAQAEIFHNEDCEKNGLYQRSHALIERDPVAAIALLKSIADKDINSKDFCSDAAQQMAEHCLYQANKTKSNNELEKARNYIQKCMLCDHPDVLRLRALYWVLKEEYVQAILHIRNADAINDMIGCYTLLLQMQSKYAENKHDENMQQQLLEKLGIDDNPITSMEKEHQRIIEKTAQQVASAFRKGLVELREGS